MRQLGILLGVLVVTASLFAEARQRADAIREINQHLIEVLQLKQQQSNSKLQRGLASDSLKQGERKLESSIQSAEEELLITPNEARNLRAGSWSGRPNRSPAEIAAEAKTVDAVNGIEKFGRLDAISPEFDVLGQKPIMILSGDKYQKWDRFLPSGSDEKSQKPNQSTR